MSQLVCIGYLVARLKTSEFLMEMYRSSKY